MVGYGGKDLQKRKVLSLEWKSEGVMDDESGESSCVRYTNTIIYLLIYLLTGRHTDHGAAFDPTAA